ncbi:hypothetical protein BDZ45DRAFT_673188 [Acephala macrosclerotiorum]|nr:hypothetical protein BDZ45DRAFT_673188 [Acephala macrosclerotiorum]
MPSEWQKSRSFDKLSNTPIAISSKLMSFFPHIPNRHHSTIPASATMVTQVSVTESISYRANSRWSWF